MADEEPEPGVEAFALECVVAFIAALVTIWVGSSGDGASTASALAVMTTSLAFLGLLNSSNPMRLSVRRVVLAASVGLYWLLNSAVGYRNWHGSAFGYWTPALIVTFCLMYLFAIFVSLAARPIVAAALGGEAPIKKVTKTLKALAVAVGAVGGLWAAISKLGGGS